MFQTLFLIRKTDGENMLKCVVRANSIDLFDVRMRKAAGGLGNVRRGSINSAIYRITEEQCERKSESQSERKSAAGNFFSPRIDPSKT